MNDDDAHAFATRVIPMFRAAVVRRDNDAHAHGWFFEAVDPQQSGYRVRGRRDEPSIRWSLLDDGAVQVVASPGQLTWVPSGVFDAAVAEALVADWWRGVTA